MIEVINYIIKRFKRADLLKHKASIIMAFLIFLLITIGVSLGAICLITMCFGLEYKFVYGLGLWLVLFLINVGTGK